jgi:hypothetical protein
LIVSTLKRSVTAVNRFEPHPNQSPLFIIMNVVSHIPSRPLLLPAARQSADSIEPDRNKFAGLKIFGFQCEAFAVQKRVIRSELAKAKQTTLESMI